jgi:hypothetical protein
MSKQRDEYARHTYECIDRMLSNNDKAYRQAQLKEHALRFGKLVSVDMYAGFTDTEFFVFVTREWQRIKAEEKKAELQEKLAALGLA